VGVEYYVNVSYRNRSRESSVGVATEYGLDDRGVGVPSPSRIENFLFFTSSCLVLGLTQPPFE
jgi:hypothetical protein